MYDALIILLRSTGIPLVEGDWNRAPQEGPYAAITLDLESAPLWGSNHQRQQAIQGSISLFCRDTDRTAFETMQAALDAVEISWKLYSVQREVSKRLMHYEWVFELENISPDAASYFYDRFPGLQVWYDEPNVSCPWVTMDGEYIEISDLGLYVDSDENLTQHFLEDL